MLSFRPRAHQPHPKAGMVESLGRLLSDARLNHECVVEGGLMAEESSNLLRAFFRERR